MVDTPDPYFGPLARAGADRVTFHAEATRYPLRTVSLAIRAGIPTVGIALNPATPLDVLAPVGDRLGLVNVLSTEPDVLGEAFLTSTFERIRRLRELVAASTEIVVDGGVGPETITDVVAAGATAVVVGRAVVRSADWALAVRTLRAGAP
jgi:ribulose-phosphate 3-epimerase